MWIILLSRKVINTPTRLIYLSIYLSIYLPPGLRSCPNCRQMSSLVQNRSIMIPFLCISFRFSKASKIQYHFCYPFTFVTIIKAFTSFLVYFLSVFSIHLYFDNSPIGVCWPLTLVNNRRGIYGIPFRSTCIVT